MTIGVGGKSQAEALDMLENRTGDIRPLPASVYRQRLESLQSQLRAAGAAAVLLPAGTNLYYFTGLRWSLSERLTAALIPAEGELRYIAPCFELDTLQDYWQLPAPIDCWEEHESPYELLGQMLGAPTADSITLLLDEATPYFMADAVARAHPQWTLGSAQPWTQSLRSIKSESEIDLIRRAHQMTLEVHRAAASILHEGISTTEVETFINQAHQRVGAAGSTFVIVLFGVATSFPHGVKDPQVLQADDWVLIDTGCLLQGYHSDITRSFCFGNPSQEQRQAWDVEKAAQLAAFAAAGPGRPCEDCDHAARKVLAEAGYGPDYQLPGLPHRTGHGCGLDIHEGPNLVRGQQEPMRPGMVFSNEPMLVIPDKFGVRLEDHFYVTDSGASWLTEPANSVDDPFGLATAD